MVFYISLLILVIISILYFRRNRTESRQYREFLNVFQNTDITIPTLKFGSSYSWPTFDITFATKEDYQFAERNGLFDDFKNRIKAYYDSKFDPERAVYFTYPGQKHVAKKSYDRFKSLFVQTACTDRCT